MDKKARIDLFDGKYNVICSETGMLLAHSGSYEGAMEALTSAGYTHEQPAASSNTTVDASDTTVSGDRATDVSDPGTGGGSRRGRKQSKEADEGPATTGEEGSTNSGDN